MNRPRLYGMRMECAGLVGIHQSIGFQSYIHTNRNNSDGPYVQIRTQGITEPGAHARLINHLLHIESFDEFCTHGGKLMPTPSQAAR